MNDIDRQIESAKKKPLTPDNLNYIGDLHVKKGNLQMAVAYFYESIDRLHFAQKEKKVAIYKKIVKVAPSSEKAYLGIVEILSKTGLVMEEKKYLGLLKKLYEDSGEPEKADALVERLKELDSHGDIPGSYSRAAGQDNLREPVRTDRSASTPEEETGPAKRDDSGIGQAWERHEVVDEAAGPHTGEGPREKLIEATLEEIIEEDHVTDDFLDRESPEQRERPVFRLKYLLLAVVAIAAVISTVLFFFSGSSKRKVSGPQLPQITVVHGEFEVTMTMLGSPDDLPGVLRKEEIENRTFAALSIRALQGCIPEAFASSPYAMISFLDDKGAPVGISTVESLGKAMRTIHKANVCEGEQGAVFMRIVLPIEKNRRYAGLSIEGIDRNGPVLIRWSGR